MTTADRVAEILGDWRARRDCGEPIDAEVVIQANPDVAEELRAEFAAMHLLNAVAARAMAETVKEPEQKAEGERVGPYRILRLLGRGGTSAVYLAEQLEPIQRKVAIKFLTESLDTEQSRARFEIERETLALMGHPNIAGVLDAGVTEEGRPYVVMEYVHGSSITTFAEQAGLGLKQRLSLFAEVCGAVQHAHQRGVMHRDIKPANVLVMDVDGRPTPKVIDFGLARSFKDGGDRSFQTAAGQVLGTPAYMSPEQARGRPMDARSDVYSLGMLLYELLTGDLPWGWDRAKRDSIAVLLRRIIEDEPPKPSERLSSAETRSQEHGDPPRWSSSLRGDLDWIVLRALEKDPERRYGSAEAFADDVRRHLADEPVLAGPPSSAYRLRKFVRRHRIGVGAAAAVVISLAAGLGAALHHEAVAREALGDAKRANALADDARGDAEGLISYMLDDLTEALKPIGRTDVLLDVAARTRAYYDGRSSVGLTDADRLRHAKALASVGQILYRQGRREDALQVYRSSARLAQDVARTAEDTAAADRQAGDSLHMVGGIQYELDDPDAGLEALHEAARLRRKVMQGGSGPVGEDRLDLANTLREIGDVRFATGQTSAALDAYREGLDETERALADGFSAPRCEMVAASVHGSMFKLYQQLPDMEAAFEAAAAAVGAYRITLVTFAESWPCKAELGGALLHLGECELHFGRESDAARHVEEAVAIFSELVELDPDNAQWAKGRARAHTWLGRLHQARGNFSAAVASHDAAASAYVRVSEGSYGIEFSLHACIAAAAQSRQFLGLHEEAEAGLARCLVFLEREPPTAKFRLRHGQFEGQIRMALAKLSADRGETSKAADRYLNAFSHLEALDADHPGHLTCIGNMCVSLKLRHDLLAELESSKEVWQAHLQQVTRTLDRLPRSDVSDWRTLRATLHAMQAECLAAQGDNKQALVSARSAYDLMMDLPSNARLATDTTAQRITRVMRRAGARELQLAEGARSEGRLADAVKHFQAALLAPGVRADLGRGSLYSAARTAAEASATAEPEARDAFAEQAVIWLKEDLERRTSEASGSRKKKRKLARHIEQIRVTAPEFATLRGTPEFEALFRESKQGPTEK